jgi:hypothetical protein
VPLNSAQDFFFPFFVDIDRLKVRNLPAAHPNYDALSCKLKRIENSERDLMMLFFQKLDAYLYTLVSFLMNHFWSRRHLKLRQNKHLTSGVGTIGSDPEIQIRSNLFASLPIRSKKNLMCRPLPDMVKHAACYMHVKYL